ncbi:hypothetical protein FPHYL_1093 [Fusarium phyllophilum]|uniref:Fungal N-terminal domain-containing protein n=1 Tax=Fusarium phyllophilum TaxID=47803 RepID=A0A8H5NM30_9HYPO|nr:hypothetical protein FPHYL_1093 [Fusarium phyllophilum]
MAEILGVAASASQLGGACFSLIDVMRKIKGGASTLKRYHEQLQELQSLSTSISENPLLQTPEIGTQTDALLFIINNNCLNSLLRKGRVFRTWGFLYKEQDLLDIFVRLERQKSNLSLAIEQIQSRTLYQIQTDIQIMSGKKEPSPNTQGVASRTSSGVLVRRDSSKSTYSSSTQATAIDPGIINDSIANIPAATSPQHTMPRNNASTTTNVESFGHPHPQSSIHYSQAGTYNYNIDDDSGPQWINPFAGSGCKQENRKIYDINVSASKELAQNPPIRCIYHNPVKVGKGDQINKNLILIDQDDEEHEGLKGFIFPDMRGDKWIHPNVIPCSTEHGEDSVSRQFNGVDIRIKKKKKRNTGKTEKKVKKEKKGK